MRYPIPQQQVAEEVVKICERDRFTPFGLLSIILDIQDPLADYGGDLYRERVLVEMLRETRLDPEDITRSVCGLATCLMRRPPAQTTDDDDTIVVSFKRTK